MKNKKEWNRLSVYPTNIQSRGAALRNKNRREEISMEGLY